VDTQAAAFISDHALKGLVLTLGDKGALALTDQGDRQQVAPSRALDVVDTVGAGDAFTSVLILGIIRGWPLQTTMERAQSFASLIVGRQGATVHDPDFYRPVIDDWGL
jgi:fructokinase